MGARTGPHRCLRRESSRSAEARRCRQSHPRQGNQSRAGAILSLPARICRVLWWRLQYGAGRASQGESERPVHPVHDWPDLREARRSGQGAGVLPQGVGSNLAQPRGSLCGSVRQEKNRFARKLGLLGLRPVVQPIVTRREVVQAKNNRLASPGRRAGSY